MLGRAKHIKTSPRVNYIKDKFDKEQLTPSPIKDESWGRILNKVSMIAKGLISFFVKTSYSLSR